MSAQTKREQITTHRFTFPREARLLRPKEYREVFQNGKKAADRAFACYISRHEGETPKLGMAVSRKVGKAVVRNRIKRQLREFFRTHRHTFRFTAQVVVVARPEAARLKSREMAEALEQLLKSRGVL